MTPEQIKQLTPDGYGGDFELTCTFSEKVQVEVQDEVTMEVGEDE